MSKKKKFYTVWKGHNTGVFESWGDCKSQIKDFPGAQYKSFSTFDAAKIAYKSNYKDYIGKTKTFKSDLSTEELKKLVNLTIILLQLMLLLVEIQEKWNIEV